MHSIEQRIADEEDILPKNLRLTFGSKLGSVLDTVNGGVIRQEVLEQNC